MIPNIKNAADFNYVLDEQQYSNGNTVTWTFPFQATCQSAVIQQRR